MERLTSKKNVSEMGMFELAHNSCYIKDGKARYRDFELDINVRDLIRKIAVKFNIFENGCAELIDDESFDETLLDCLQYSYETKEGLIALFYRNLWAMADLHDKLKEYEDLDEEGRFLYGRRYVKTSNCILQKPNKKNNRKLCSKRNR